MPKGRGARRRRRRHGQPPPNTSAWKARPSSAESSWLALWRGREALGATLGLPPVEGRRHGPDRTPRHGRTSPMGAIRPKPPRGPCRSHGPPPASWLASLTGSVRLKANLSRPWKRPAGRCHSCLQPAAPGRSSCRPCLAKDVATQAARRLAFGRRPWHRPTGGPLRCTQCQAPPAPGKRMCLPHAQREAEQRRRRMSDPELRRKAAEAARLKRAARKAEGAAAFGSEA